MKLKTFVLLALVPMFSTTILSIPAHAAPSAPLNVAAASASVSGATPTSAALTITWNRPSSYADIVAYVVKATATGQATATASVVANSNISSYSSTLSNLTGGSTYSVTVSSVDVNGIQTSASAVSVVAQSVPTSPVPVSATAGIGKIDLTWTAPTSSGGSSITGYTIKATGVSDKTAAADATTYSVTGLSAGVSYTFTILATNALGNSAVGTFSATTVKAVTSAPTGVTATLSGTTGINVQWSSPATGASTVISYTATLKDAATLAAISGKTSTVSGTTSTSFANLSAGSYVVTVVATNDVGDSESSTASNSITISSSSLTANDPVFNPTSLSDVDPAAVGRSLSATAPSGETPTITTSGPCSYASSTISSNGATAGTTCTITATTVGDSTYAAGQNQISFNFKSAQTITFGSIANQTLPVSGTIDLTPTSTSNLSVTVTSNSTGVCTVAANKVTVLSNGTCSLTANQNGNSSYFAASAVTQTFTISKSAQVITFDDLQDKTLPVSGTIATNVSISSPLTVTLTSATPTICGISGGQITVLKNGVCTISATQTGNANYAAATTVEKSFTISKRSHTLSFTAVSAQQLPASDVTLSATSDRSLTSITYASSTLSVCTVTGNKLSFVGAGTCTVSASEPGDANTLSATASQNITITAAAGGNSGGGGGNTSTSTPTTTPTPTPSPSPTSSATSTPAPTTTPSPSPSSSASPRPTPTPTPTIVPTPTPSITPSQTPSSEPTFNIGESVVSKVEPKTPVSVVAVPKVTSEIIPVVDDVPVVPLAKSTIKSNLPLKTTEVPVQITNTLILGGVTKKELSQVPVVQITSKKSTEVQVASDIPTRITITALPKGTTAVVKVVIANRSITLGTVKTDENGKVILPPLTFTEKSKSATIQLVVAGKTNKFTIRSTK